MIVAWLMLARPKRPSRLIDLAGVAGLGVLVVVAATVTTTTAWLYRGGFTAISLASVALVVAATQPFGVVSKVLSLTPLRLLGRISYGIYLYHWPIFLWLTPTRTHLATLPLLAVRLSVTLAVAIVSFALLERPILRGGVLRRGRGAWVSVGGGSVVLASAVLFGSMPTASAAIDFEHFRQQLARRSNFRRRNTRVLMDSERGSGAW